MAKRLRDVCTCRKANRSGVLDAASSSDPPWTVEKLRVIWRSGVSAERRHLKTSGNICGGLPRRRYEEGESSAGSLKIGATGFAGRQSNY